MPLAFRAPLANRRALVIASTRVKLVALADEDTWEIYRNFTAEIARYMMPAPAADISETRAFVAAALLGLDLGDDLHFVIFKRNDGTFLGVCGLHGTGPAAEPELGIWLRKAAHGNRYGLEAIRVLRDWASRHLYFERLIYPVDRRNVPSLKIAEALGGRVIGEKKVMSMSGVELDEVVYGIPPAGGSSS
jgi:RimJ/RimL family protein N-acetyltransferase